MTTTNVCAVCAKDCYAVIFTNRKKVDDAGYQQMAETMERLAQKQPGYLAIDSARNHNGFGISVSYWQDLQSIKQWKAQAEHQIAQEYGRSKWYSDYSVRIAKVEREYFWQSDSD